MNKNDYLIRLETPVDHAEVEYLVRESFWNVYRPGCLEHYVLHCLRKDKAFVPELDFYGKSGFTYSSAFGIRYHGLPEGEDASFFLCKELIPGYLDGVTGEYATPEGHFVDEAKAEEFDKQFPYKEKLKLPGQLV